MLTLNKVSAREIAASALVAEFAVADDSRLPGDDEVLVFLLSASGASTAVLEREMNMLMKSQLEQHKAEVHAAMLHELKKWY